MTRRKWFWVLVKLMVAAVGVWLIVTTVAWQDRTVTLADGTTQVEPGAWGLMRSADPVRLMYACLWASPLVFVQSLRWWLLLTCRGVPVRWFAAFRLTWAGQFFSVCLPGSTGGDLVRAGYAARTSGNRATAVLSLVVDRVTGLSALVLLGTVSGMLMWSDPVAGGPAQSIAAVALCLVVGTVVYTSPKLRGLLKVEGWLLRVPGVGGVLAKVDQALYGYRDHWPTVLAAIGLSLGLHVCLVLAFSQAGYAMGMTVPLGRMFVVMPVIMVTIALPITYQGLGVADKLAVALLVTDAGQANANQIVAMLMVLRLINLSMGLLGAWTLIGGKLQLHGPDAPKPAPVPA